MEGGLLSLKWNNHRSSFIHVLSSLRKKDSFCDVTLACDGKFYPSHKLVLSTCSEYFQEMFQHTECKHPIIVLKDIRCEDLESLLNYMYIGEVNVLQEKLSTLIKVAECLKIKGLAVPDDPPSEKRVHGHDLASESKRRKTDSDHYKSKDYSRSHSKSSKSSDSLYKQNVNISNPYRSPNTQTESEAEPNNYNFDSGLETSNKTKELDDSVFIKQEPSDGIIDVEDSKEGILADANQSFLSPLSQEENSNAEIMGSSESQDIWGSENRSSENYSTLEGGSEGGGPGNETGSQNESAREADADEAASFPQSIYYPRTPHVCSRCHYVARDKTNLRKHIFTHTGEKPFVCKLCDYKTTQSSNLRSHIRRKHSDTSLNQRELEEEDYEDTPRHEGERGRNLCRENYISFS